MNSTLKRIIQELEQMENHMKKYYRGAYPAMFLQLHSPLEISEILEMRLGDLLYCDKGKIKMYPDIVYRGKKIVLEEKDRKELAWCLLQRVPAVNAEESMLEDWLCVNIQGQKLKIHAYRKMLLRTNSELNFDVNYSATRLHSLYGYMEIATGKKSVIQVAREYQVSRSYLLQRIFKNMDVDFMDYVIEQVANAREEEDDDMV